MPTILRIGPADHGRPMTLDEFDASDYQDGYKYELIDGKLEVSPQPNVPEGLVEDWIERKLQRYREDNPQVTNLVYSKARVFVPNRPGETVPEPDLAAYQDFPLARPWREIHWQDVSPILVVEILAGNDPYKDLVRNAALYFQVSSIKEYWVVDAREDPDYPTLLVHRRQAKRWKKLELAYGDTYTTRLLPGFTLTIDPRS